MSGAEELDRFYGTERKIVGAHSLYYIKVEDAEATVEGRFLGVDSAKMDIDKEFLDRFRFGSECLANRRQTYLAAGAASVRG